MERFYRIFGRAEPSPEPESVLARLRERGHSVTGDFAGDSEGWFRAVLEVDGLALHLERYLSHEEGIRAELNAWAAVLEECVLSPHHGPLMEWTIQARQLFTLRQPNGPDDGLIDRVCVAVCKTLAEQTGGFYQADDRGFFAADGTLLVPSV